MLIDLFCVRFHRCSSRALKVTLFFSSENEKGVHLRTHSQRLIIILSFRNPVPLPADCPDDSSPACLSST